MQTRPSSNLQQLLDELDRIEELLEDMTDLGISNRDEAAARMHELNALVDELEAT